MLMLAQSFLVDAERFANNISAVSVDLLGNLTLYLLFCQLFDDLEQSRFLTVRQVAPAGGLVPSD